MATIVRFVASGFKNNLLKASDAVSMRRPRTLPGLTLGEITNVLKLTVVMID